MSIWAQYVVKLKDIGSDNSLDKLSIELNM